MKKIFFLLTLICLLAACAPQSTPAIPAASSPTPGVKTISTEAAPTQPVKPTKAPQSTASAPSKSKTEQPKPTQAESTAKPKGKDPAVVPTSSNPKLIASEILGRPTSNSITVNVVPAVGMELYYEYGTSPGSYTARTAAQKASAGAPLETLISGLQPNTRYYYRLRSADLTGEERTFTTARAPGSTFTFAIQGDSHPERIGNQFEPTLYERTLRSAAASQPDFFFTIGDDFSVDTLKTVNAETVRELYINQRQWLGLVEAPVFLVNGNHEQASLANLDGTPNNVAVWAQTSRNAYYPQPAPDAFYTGDAQPVEHIGLLRDYYAFTWGDALFVVIDPYWHSPQTVDNQFGADRDEKKNRDLWNVTLGEAQYQWFKRTLETSTAQYKFVFAHHINGTGRGGIELADSYEWGDAAQFKTKRPGWDAPIHQLMAQNQVTIFFQGHDHLFARQELDGVIYQTLPEPAHPGYTTENDDAFTSGVKYPNSGHLQVTVSPEGVKVDYIRSYLEKADELAYSYTVR